MRRQIYLPPTAVRKFRAFALGILPILVLVQTVRTQAHPVHHVQVHHHPKHIRYVDWFPLPVLRRYLAADFAGSRIRHDDRASTTTEVTWKSEPPWDHVIIVQHYDFGHRRTFYRKARITVTFFTLGELKGNVFYPDRHKETVTFGLLKIYRRWKVDRPILVPHISVSAAEKYLTKSLAKADPGTASAKAIQASLNELKKLR